MGKHLLLVDDDALLRRSLAFNLQRAGYRVSTAASAEDALALAKRDVPDLVLLDIGLPGIDGLDALQYFGDGAFASPSRLRTGWSPARHIPVIFLSARRRELDQVLGLELGADDYITKPFDLDVLLARVKAVLRRSGSFAGTDWADSTGRPGTGVAPAPLTVGDIVIDAVAHTVNCAGHAIVLPPREFDVLYALALEAGHVISVDNLVARVWGAEYEGEPQVAYVHIRWLRQKLEEDPHRPRRILTVRGVGYKLEPQPEAGAEA